MNQRKIERDLEVGAAVSPFAIFAGFAAFAGAGYLLWMNRAKIQTFFKNQDLKETFDHVGQIVSEGASRVSGILHQEVKPLTNSLHSAIDKPQSAVK